MPALPWDLAPFCPLKAPEALEEIGSSYWTISANRPPAGLMAIANAWT